MGALAQWVPRRPPGAPGPGGDAELAQLDTVLQHAAGADADERRPRRDGQDLGHGDLDIVRADAGRDDRDAPAAVGAGDRGELAVPLPQLDALEARGDALGAVGVTGEEDVLGQFPWSECDVILPFAIR